MAMRPIMLCPSVNHSAPSGPAAMHTGAPLVKYEVTAPAGVKRARPLLKPGTNQRAPSEPAAIEQGTTESIRKGQRVFANGDILRHRHCGQHQQHHIRMRVCMVKPPQSVASFTEPFNYTPIRAGV